MGVLSIILLVLFVIAALLLIFLVAVQDEKSQGLGGIFGGSSDSTFGSGSSKFLTKFTAIIAAAFIVLALLVGLSSRSSYRDNLAELAASQAVTAPVETTATE